MQEVKNKIKIKIIIALISKYVNQNLVEKEDFKILKQSLQQVYRFCVWRNQLEGEKDCTLNRLNKT